MLRTCFCTPFVLRWGPAPPPPLKFVQGGLSTPGSNFNSKNHHFSDDFPVIFWYIHIMLLHWITLTSNLIIESGKCTLYMTIGHEAEHSISDVPKHSSSGGLNPPEFPLPPCQILPLWILKIQHPGQYHDIFRIYIDDIFQKHYKTNYCLVTNKFN